MSALSLVTLKYAIDVTMQKLTETTLRQAENDKLNRN